jgi:hypothetical protein
VQPGVLPDNRAHIAYRRLIETGWLVEHRDRYRRVVDFDGHARIILQLLLDIKAGRTRSYGGEVLGVLSNLEAAQSDPQRKSEGVRNAAKSARSFMNHLRSVASAMRTIEQEISATTELAPLFRRFFDDFVSEHLVEDYKRLHTDANPFRFRVQILEVCEQMLGETLILDSLADGYVVEGRAASVTEGRATIEEELRTIARAFDALDEHLEIIDAVNRRIEVRVRNTVRHMERINDAHTEDVAAAMQVLGRLAVTTVPPGPLPILHDAIPFGQAHLFQNARKRTPPERKPVKKTRPDPAFLAFHEALAGYRERMRITPDKVQAYLARAMQGRQEAHAADLPIATLDDFIVFERLPLLRWMEDEELTRSFLVHTIEGSLFSNPWISCPDFVVRRILAGAVNA